jgi:predicted ATPase/class 3 adenylate cyclase
MAAASPLPAGTVTFLFTDIERSTQLWEEHPEEMRQALSRHDALLRQVIQSHGGHVFKTVGDAFCAAFATAPEATTAAVAIQRALAGDVGRLGGEVAERGGEAEESGFAADAFPVTSSHPPPRLRVRIAVHTGAAEARDGDYFGPPLNRVARLLEAAHGGQILLSLAAQELTRDDLPEGFRLKDLGQHRLRDLIRPEQIFQLLAPNLPSRFPPLKTLDSRPNNLPAQPTPLIGRETEAAMVCERLRQAETRLLTLTGPAGTGKTRLGLQVAAALLDAFADGVYFVALAPIRDPSLVLSPIAEAMEIRETGDRPLLDHLKEHLREKQILLLLDNFEQILSAAPLVAELLKAAPRLKVLVTSRAVLHLRGEQEFAVPPLAMPDRKRLPPIPVLSQYAAVQLFIQRAVGVSPGFVVTNENAAAVAAICHCLDGLPLAIELAAARIKLLPPKSILTRLESRLRLLTGGARDLPARQQTLRGAIAWSYDLLDESEKLLFRRLAVFVGGCTLEAAEAISGEIQNLDILDGVVSLVNKSLLCLEAADGSEARVWMLETIREYGLECLKESGEAEQIHRQHARYFLDWAEQAEWTGFEKEHDNLRAALAWLTANEEAEAAFRLASAVWIFWYLRGHWTEGRERLRELQALPDASPLARAMLLRQAGQLTYLQSDYPAARSLLEQSIILYRGLRNTDNLPSALNALGEVAATQGDYETACSLFMESLALLQAQGKTRDIAWAMEALAGAAQQQGDYELARRFIREGLVLFEEVGDQRGISSALTYLAEQARAQGDLSIARSLHEKSLAIRRELGNKAGIAGSLANLAMVVASEGDYQTARTLCQESLSLRRELGDRLSIAMCLERIAALASLQGQPVHMARLLGAAEALREAVGAPLQPADRADYERHVETARAALGETAFTAAWSEGRSMPLGQALACASEETVPI